MDDGIMNQYLGWIPPNAHTILEFGCGDGSLGKMFKEVQPDCFFVGIDNDIAALECAEANLDIVLKGNDRGKILKIIEEYAPWDCVVYRDKEYFNNQSIDIHMSNNGQILVHNNAECYNFPWRMAKRNIKKPFQIVSLFQDPVCAFMRMIIPNSFYKTNPDINVVEMDLGKLWEQNALNFGEPYILLFQRVLSKSLDGAVKLQNRLASFDALMIHEFDDWPERWNNEYNNTRYMDFVGCHVVQTTTPLLADYFRQYNPYVLTFPNELCNLPAKRNCIDKEHINIFFGAVNREDDWREIMPILNEAVVRYGEKIHFLVVADKLFYEKLHTPYKRFIGEGVNNGRFVPYNVYEDTLHKADIALLPLKNTMFNRMKSDLKFIESAGHGAAVLASTVVYEHSIKDGKTGLLYSNLREFRYKLFQLIEKIEIRKKISDNAYNYVKHNRLMCQHYEERIEIYKELMMKKNKLEIDRQHRIVSWSG